MHHKHKSALISLAAVSCAYIAGTSFAYLNGKGRLIHTSLRAGPLDTSEELPDAAKAWAERNLVDEKEEMGKRPFPIPPDELVKKAKLFLALNNGFAGVKGDALAEEFEFAGPVVGPLKRQAYLDSIKGFDFNSAFPDATFQMYDFRVDAFETNRVWFTSRGYGTQTGVAKPLFAKPNGKSYVNPPQTCSIRFNQNGLVDQYTIGYVMDRRVGNTGGLGGIYGILYAVGKPFPFPEANPHKPSLRMRLFNKLGALLAQQSAKEDTTS